MSKDWRASRPVKLLNASYEELGYITPEKAISMLAVGTAYPTEVEPDKFVHGPPDEYGNPRVMFAWPVEIMLVNWVNVPYIAKEETQCTRRGVLRRDGHTCGYCGKPGDTWDHILPQSRGGESSWTNTITACFSCNNAKDNKTPEEAGMTLLWPPREPDKIRQSLKSQKKNSKKARA